MIERLLASRVAIPSDPDFLAAGEVSRLIGAETRARYPRLQLHEVCTADVSNEVQIDGDNIHVVIDLAAIEMAFCFTSGFAKYGYSDRTSPSYLNVLRLMLTLSLNYGDERATAGLLAEFVHERCRLEAVLGERGLVLDARDGADAGVKRVIAAFAVAHEISHFLFRADRTFRLAALQSVEETLQNTVAAFREDPEFRASRGLQFAEAMIASLDGDGRMLGDAEEVACDIMAGEAVLRCIAADGVDADAIGPAFAAVQSVIATTWLVAALRDSLEHMLLGHSLGAARRGDLLAGRSLLSAAALAAHRMRVIEGRKLFDEPTARRILADIPDPDEVLIKLYDRVLSPEALMQRDCLAAIHLEFDLYDRAKLKRSAIGVLRFGLGNPP